MFYKKFFTLLLCFIFLGQTFSQTALKTEAKKSELSPEIREKTTALLNNLARSAEQFSLPANRVGARVLVAGLLWDSDEKQARSVFQSAVSELTQIVAQIPLENSDSEEEFNTERYMALNDARNMRNELLMALATRDPAFALEALQALSRKNAADASIFEDDKNLELSVAAQIAEKDPKQAYELARRNLEEAIGANAFTTLESLYEKDSELGGKLAQDIFGKIKSKDAKITSRVDNIGNVSATGNIVSNQMISSDKTAVFTVNLWEIQAFLDTVKKLNRKAAKNKKTAVLSESEITETIDILAQLYIKQPYLSAYEVSKAMPEITKYFPAQAQAIRRKIGQSEGSMLNNLIGTQLFQDETEDKTSEEILQIIEKKPAQERDDLYWKAAETSISKGEIEEAKKFYGKIKTRREYDYLGKVIDSALPLKLAEKGDLRDTREILAKLKTPEERIEVLTTLAGTIGKNGDKKAAAALLNEARSLYSGRMKNRKNLSSVLSIARAYAILEPEQSFAFLESNLPFFNELIAAAILLDEFNETGAVQNEELRIEAVRRESYRNAPKAVALIKNLAVADFDRLANFADKFSRPEARFFAAYRIAESLLDPKAEETEKNFQANIEGEANDH